MNQKNRFRLLHFLSLALGIVAISGCVPQATRRPTLNEARLGKGTIESELALRPGEMRAEVVEIDPGRQELRVRTDDGRRQPVTLAYDRLSTKVTYMGRDYTVDHLEAGDIIAFETRPRSSNFVDTIRVQEPVQARAGGAIARRSPAPRPEVIEGTVEKVDVDLGVFDVRPRSGRTVTVSVPYNARSADVESFRRLRRGDRVRLEGEFVNPESFQLLAFLSDSDRRSERR